MDEFDFDTNNEIGTSVNQLKTQNDYIQFDYDKIQEHLNSENSNQLYNDQNNKTKSINIVKPKKQQNIDKFIKELEYNLDNFDKINLNEPLPVNFTKEMIPKKQVIKQPTNIIKETPKSIPIISTIPTLDKFKNVLSQFNYREILIHMLLFMVLNNKVIIELIYNRIPYMKKYDSPYPNLIIRTLIFGIILFLIKKFII